MLEILPSEFDSPQLETLYRWFSEEWDDVDTFRDQKNGVRLPAPILAFKENALIGGLAFTGYRKPGGADAGLWICALYVLPAKRGAGVASRLIQAAEELARNRGFAELYARSESPALYQKQRWVAHQQQGESTVLRKAL